MPKTGARPPKVLMVLPRLGRLGRAGEGGITRAVNAWLAAGLADHVEIEMAALAEWDAPVLMQVFQSAGGFIKLGYRLVRQSRRPDLVHLHVSSGGSLYRKYIASRLAQLLRIPVIVHLHSGGFQEWVCSRRLHWTVSRRLFRSAVVVVVLAERWRGLAEALGASAVRVIPHLLRPGLADALAACAGHRSAPPRADEEITVLYYGRWAPIKGLDVLAASIRRLRPSDQRRLRLVIFGNGDSAWLRQCFDGTALVAVEIHGWLDDARKPDEFTKAAAVVLPSRSEAFGASLLEAMAAGVPLIVSDAGAIPEVVRDYPLLRVTRRADDTDLCNALRDLLDGSWPEGTTVAPSLPARYSAASVVAQLVELYDFAVGKRDRV